MEYSYSKTQIATAYNVVVKETIAGSADVFGAPGPGEGFILEFFPYPLILEKIEDISLTPQDKWQTFRDTHEDGNAKTETDILKEMIRSVIQNYVMLDDQIVIKKRKEVFRLKVIKNDREHELLLINELEPFVNSDPLRFTPALYVHDVDNYDIWRFDPGTPDEQVLQDIYFYLR